MTPFRVLVVDDDRSTCLFLRTALEALGLQCASVHTSEEAEAFVREHDADLVLLDVYLGSSNGIDLLARLRAFLPRAYYVVMTAHVSMETAARSVAEGAVEYQAKPLLVDELAAIVQRAQAFRAEPRRRDTPLSPEPPVSSIIGRSARMLEIYRTVARVAPSNAHVLITGASGTGKELVARAIHDYSSRSDKPFTPVNCGSLTETILESELFGHEKGAFTGADSARKGLIEATDGGTLFLDEVTETSLGFQVKLLRFVQEQQVRRLGSNKYLPVDVRVLAATNRDPVALVGSGQFRGDLFYRLSVVQIALPSLADRREDIPLLIDHFLRQFNSRNSSQVRIEPAATHLLSRMDWPGNVRELENMVQRQAIFASSGVISAADVERFKTPVSQAAAVTQAATVVPIAGVTPAIGKAPEKLTDLERDHIQRVLQESGGNRSEAARRLGIERKTLYKKAERLGIDLNVREK
jgi:DNA-binding NtrC family response regulator